MFFQAYLRAISFFCILTTCSLSAICSNDAAPENHPGHGSNPVQSVTKKTFDPGELILGHVVDDHSWHLADVGNQSIAIPLPVFLIYDGHFYAFMSSRFHHGTKDYRHFRLMQEGPHKGKIVHMESSGEVSPTLPLDLSLTKNAVAMIIAAALLFGLFFAISKKYERDGSNKAPSGWQNMLEPLVLFVRDDVCKGILDEAAQRKYLPYLLTLFFFILINNVMGLIPIFPGGANVTGNIAVTMVLALLTFLITTFSGKRTYYTHLVNYPGAPWWIKFPLPLLPLVEIMGVFTKPFVLMIRLFANITAGHIVVLGFFSLIFLMGEIAPLLGGATAPIAIAFALFISLLEIIVAFVQAYVFTLLTCLYISSAIEKPHPHKAIIHLKK